MKAKGVLIYCLAVYRLHSKSKIMYLNPKIEFINVFISALSRKGRLIVFDAKILLHFISSRLLEYHH